MSSLYYPTNLPFPTTLPDAKARFPGFIGRYGLLHTLCGGRNNVSKLPDSVPLKAEMSDYEQFYKTPIQLDRHSSVVKSSTYDDHVKMISKVLGYMYRYENVPQHLISLKLFSNQELLINFMAFLWLKSEGTLSMTNTIYKCQRVVEWLSVTDAANNATKQEHLGNVHAMLSKLANNFLSAYPNGKLSGGLAPPPPLPKKEAIFDWQQLLKHKALDILVGDQVDLPGSAVMQDWLISEWLSNNIPAVRLACIRSLQVPPMYSGVDYKCENPECPNPQCKGNRLEIVDDLYYDYSQERISLKPTPAEFEAWAKLQKAGDYEFEEEEPQPEWQQVIRGSEATLYINSTPGGGLHSRWDSDENDTSMDTETFEQELPVSSMEPTHLNVFKIVLPHHKEEKEWGPYPLMLELPYDLALTTYLHLTYAYPKLNWDGDNNYMLVKPNTGGALYLAEDLTNLWKDIQIKHEAPWVAFPPNSFRDIHIMDRVLHLSQVVGNVGQQLVGDATVMQNTVGGVWEKRYCKGGFYFITMAEGALDRMTRWRHSQYTRLLGAGPSSAHATD
jgi:hypothetical protein